MAIPVFVRVSIPHFNLKAYMHGLKYRNQESPSIYAGVLASQPFPNDHNSL